MRSISVSRVPTHRSRNAGRSQPTTHPVVKVPTLKSANSTQRSAGSKVGAEISVLVIEKRPPHGMKSHIGSQRFALDILLGVCANAIIATHV
jgi:hypothetical protein